MLTSGENTGRQRSRSAVDMSIAALGDSSAIQARSYAQFIAFAPMMFFAAKSLRDNGILKLLIDKGSASEQEITRSVSLSSYAVNVLLRAGETAGLIKRQPPKNNADPDLYQVTTTGLMLVKDEMTKVNMNFVADICYAGMENLQESLEQGVPMGLKKLGPWESVYQGLSELSEKQQESWFAFDHYYSDQAFPEAIPQIFSAFDHEDLHILDVGGNTGKFAWQCLSYHRNCKVTVLDLPGQLRLLKRNLDQLQKRCDPVDNLESRLEYLECDVLAPEVDVHGSYDLIWMSQFLDCFAKSEIVRILGIAARVLAAGRTSSKLAILETFVDCQRFAAAEYSLAMTSLYFTGIANGNSKMYDYKEFLPLIHKAGLVVESVKHNIGLGHSLVICSLPR